MDFELPVNYNGKNYVFPGLLHLFSYGQKIEMNVNGLSVMYERDDERNWRAIVDSEQLKRNKSINVELLRAIADSLETVLS